MSGYKKIISVMAFMKTFCLPFALLSSNGLGFEEERNVLVIAIGIGFNYEKYLSDIPASSKSIILAQQKISNTRLEEIRPFYKNILLVSSYYGSSQVESEALKIHKEKPLTHIVATGETDIMRAAELREYLNLPGQQKASALFFRDKAHMKDVLKENGFYVPSYRKVKNIIDIHRFLDQFGYPAILKPRLRQGSAGIYVLGSRDDVLALDDGKDLFNYRYQTDLEIETYQNHPMYVVDGFLHEGKVVMSWPSMYVNSCLDMLKKGSFLGTYLLEESNKMTPKLRKYTQDIFEKIKTDHSTAFHLEVFYSSSEDKFIVCEVASRVGGGLVNHMIREAFNIDLESEFTRCQAGFAPSPALLNFSEFSAKPASIAGEVIFPAREGILRKIQKEPKFPWIRNYRVNFKENDTIKNPENIVETIASGLILAESENDFLNRLASIVEWFNTTTLIE